MGDYGSFSLDVYLQQEFCPTISSRKETTTVWFVFTKKIYNIKLPHKNYFLTYVPWECVIWDWWYPDVGDLAPNR